MSRKINLTESDLTNLVRKTIDEAVTGGGFGCCNGSMHCAHGCCGCKGQGLMGGHCCDSNEDPNGEFDPGGKVVTGGADKGKGKNYQKTDHKKKSEVRKPEFEKNIREGYKKFGCKFLQNHKSLNEDRLQILINTGEDLKEQRTLSKKINFIESTIGLSSCDSILREQKESTYSSGNDLRRVRKLIYENMNWDSVQRNNNNRILENIKRNVRTI
tara:strand:- start:90 stop:731 length:642 start_codon:yes stop_codon:yes gene_type:complete